MDHRVPVFAKGRARLVARSVRHGPRFRPVAVVEVVDAAHPGDTGPLETWLDANPLAEVLCILGKTEGNGCVNDYTRGYATSAIKDALRRVQSRRIVRASDDMRRKLPKLYESRMEDAAIIMSGGTEGEHSPIDPLSQFCFPLSTHTFPFTRRSPVPPLYRVRELIRREGRGQSCAQGQGRTARALRDPHEGLQTRGGGHAGNGQETRRAIQECMGLPDVYRGDLSESDEIFVQIKCPLLTPERVAEAAARGQTCATTDSYKSMALSRGASTIGAAEAIETLRGLYDPVGYEELHCDMRRLRLLLGSSVILRRRRAHALRDTGDGQNQVGL